MKNKFLFMLYSLCLGGIIGFIIWLFLKVLNVGTNLIWNVLPNQINIPFYTIIVCLLGGLIIGVWKKKTGDYPEELEEVISKVKKDGRYSYDKIGTLSVSAMLPLLFGGSVGPEAGLTGIIVGLCTWVSDKFKHLFKEMKELTHIGISATLSTIFNSPMFGFVEPIESDEEMTLPKKSKIILYFIAIFGAIGSMMLLNYLFKGSSGLINFKGFSTSYKEWLFLIPLSLIGVVFGILYSVFKKCTNKLSDKLGDKVITKCLIAGLILGVLGTMLPYTMFSGELQMEIVMDKYKEIGIVVLLLTGILKLFVTNSCISLGFKGGHFFPCIFSGVCLGYAFGMLLNINLVFSVCIVTTSLMAYSIKKPFATILLLMICFPIKAIPVMLLASVIGSFINSKKEV